MRPGPLVDVASGLPVALADINLDGKLDNVASDTRAGTLSIFLSLGAGAFDAGTTYINDVNSLSLPLGDLNGDHKPDFALFASTLAPQHIGLHVLLNACWSWSLRTARAALESDQWVTGSSDHHGPSDCSRPLRVVRGPRG